MPSARLFIRGLHVALPIELLASLEVIVSELVTNAVLHAATPFEVAVVAGPPMRVTVTDGDSLHPPILRPPTLSQTSGWGLQLVDCCSHRWGWECQPGGKAVWAEIGGAD